MSSMRGLIFFIKEIKVHGGKREGAGRKPGAKAKIVKAAVVLAVVSGKLPHELLLEWARGGKMMISGKPVALTSQQCLAAAIAAGSYYAPRLISHEVSGKGGGAIPMSVTGQVSFYIPENSRRVAPAAPANDEQKIAVHSGNGEAKAA